jgi:hypothetical protein
LPTLQIFLMKMNKIVVPVIALIAVLIAAGCSEKFNTAAPYKNITVVYAFLDKADTAHYIRIQKAFLDQNKSAVTMAQSPDSNFYSNIDVRIERYSFTGILADTIHLNRVNLETEGYPKQTGVFFNSPNYAYKFTNTLDVNYIYRLKVINLTTHEVDSADAPIIDDQNSSSFYVDLFDDSLLNKGGLAFSSTFLTFEFGGTYTPPANFSFVDLSSPSRITLSSPVGIIQAIIRFNWVDSNDITHALTPHYYDYNLGFSTLTSPTQFDFKIKDIDLYSALSTGMGAPPDNNTFRLLDRTDVFVYLSTYDYLLYVQNSLTQGTGLTGSEIEPVFTNIKGPNALGLYTSRGVRTNRVTISPSTVDSLMVSSMLQQARIAGTSYHQ